MKFHRCARELLLFHFLCFSLHSDKIYARYLQNIDFFHVFPIIDIHCESTLLTVFVSVAETRIALFCGCSVLAETAGR